MGDAPETSIAGSRWQRIGSFFREELRPTPGRLKGSLVRVAGTLLALWVGLALNLPEMGAVLSLAFFGSTRDRALGKKVAMGVPPTVFLVFLLVTLFLNIFGAVPLARIVAFIALIFASLFLIQAAKQGALFLMIGIFGKLFLNLWDNGYPSELIQELQLWIVADLVVAGLCAIIVILLFGDREKNPVKEFRDNLASRFDLIARFVSSPIASSGDDKKLREEALCTEKTVLPLLDQAKAKDEAIKSHYQSLVAVTRLCVLLLHESILLKTYSSDARIELSEMMRWVGDRCRAIASALRSGDLPVRSEVQPPSVTNAFAAMMRSTVELAEGVLARRVLPPKDQRQAASKGFLQEDAFTNPAYLSNALKATLAAFVCYFFIAASDWDDIGTAVTTCLITALTTRMQSRQKQSLRLAGALTGGILGGIAIAFVLPHGMGVTGVSIVTAVVAFLGAWVFEGGPRLSYAGVQLIICYLLGVFGGNGTPTSLIGLRDRVLGILIGNIAMWLFYDGIQPVWTPDSTRKSFADSLVALGRLAGIRAGIQNTQHAVLSLIRERKAFVDASSKFDSMRSPGDLELTVSRNRQREKAPQIGRTESRLHQLFSFEYVATETKLLGLPSIPGGGSACELSDSLLSLASLVRGENLIRGGDPPLNERLLPRDELLVARLRAEFANLYSS